MPPETNSPRIISRGDPNNENRNMAANFSIHERLYMLGKDQIAKSRLRNCRSVGKDRSSVVGNPVDFKKSLRDTGRKSPMNTTGKHSECLPSRRGS